MMGNDKKFWKDGCGANLFQIFANSHIKAEKLDNTKTNKQTKGPWTIFMTKVDKQVTHKVKQKANQVPQSRDIPASTIW